VCGLGVEHLRLFAEHNALGVQASVYNVIAKTGIAPSEPVDDPEQGKERAATHAQQYLKRVGEFGTAAPTMEGIAVRLVLTGFREPCDWSRFPDYVFIGFYIRKSIAASAYGAAGSLVVVIAWIYCSALLLYFGRVYARTLGSQSNGEDPTNAGRSFGRARQTRSGGILS
jgi:hypothetical protein